MEKPNIFIILQLRHQELLWWPLSIMSNIRQNTLWIVAFLLLSMNVSATEVETTNDLTIYYPQFTRMDLALGKMPDASDRQVDFCCEAAFTGQRLATFRHTNVADDHISGGQLYKGYSCRANTGAFVWGKSGWTFLKKSNYSSVAGKSVMGFCQYLIILDGKRTPMWERMRKNRTRYRALCEKDGKLCLIESKKVVTLEYFVNCLVGCHVTQAIYLDMGAGWNYAWYRNAKGEVKEIFPESKQASDYQYRTNWVVFYK